MAEQFKICEGFMAFPLAAQSRGTLHSRSLKMFSV